jgi:hypothetical protein
MPPTVPRGAQRGGSNARLGNGRARARRDDKFRRLVGTDTRKCAHVERFAARRFRVKVLAAATADIERDAPRAGALHTVNQAG